MAGGGEERRGEEKEEGEEGQATGGALLIPAARFRSQFSRALTRLPPTALSLSLSFSLFDPPSSTVHLVLSSPFSRGRRRRRSSSVVVPPSTKIRPPAPPLFSLQVRGTAVEVELR